MADTTAREILAGGGGDLRIDASRCLRMRFSESSCRRCAELCPHAAVSLSGALSIDAKNCTGCLLCTAHCPVGALEPSKDFSASLAQLSRMPEPILGCSRTAERYHATLACLGGLSAEHLVALSHSLSGTLTLNQTACSGCPNNATVSRVQHLIAAMTEAGLFDGGCRIVMAASAEELRYCDESVGRRSFFKAFGKSMFQNAAVILSTRIDAPELRTEYGGKRLPVRRELLNRSREGVAQELATRIGAHFDFAVSFSDSCTSCHGCVAICPTGALKAEEGGMSPSFDPRLCTGCGVCREFCLDGALQIA